MYYRYVSMMLVTADCGAIPDTCNKQVRARRRVMVVPSVDRQPQILNSNPTSSMTPAARASNTHAIEAHRTDLKSWKFSNDDGAIDPTCPYGAVTVARVPQDWHIYPTRHRGWSRNAPHLF